MNEERLLWCLEHKEEYQKIIDYMMEYNLTEYCYSSLKDWREVLKHCEKEIDELKNDG